MTKTVPGRERKAAAEARQAAWQDFERALADSLGQLDEGEFLIVSMKRANIYVQFAAGGDKGMRAEAVSNSYIEPPQALLSVEDYEHMRALGWSGATRAADAPPESDPDGSPNFFFDFDAPVPFAAVAALAVRALREVYAVKHPRRLEYKAFAEGGMDIRFPALGIPRRRPDEPRRKAAATSSSGPLMPVVRAALEELEWEGEAIDDDTLRVGVAGEHVKFSLVIATDDELRIVVCYGVLPNTVAAPRRAAVAEALARINYGLRIGAFDIDFDDGEVRFRNSMDVEGGALTPQMAVTLIGSACTTIDRFYPAIARVQFGDDPAEAVRDAWAEGAEEDGEE